jgi:hypothetical protein
MGRDFKWKQIGDFDEEAEMPSRMVTDNARPKSIFNTSTGILSHGKKVIMELGTGGGGGGGGGGGSELPAKSKSRGRKKQPVAKFTSGRALSEKKKAAKAAAAAAKREAEKPAAAKRAAPTAPVPWFPAGLSKGEAELSSGVKCQIYVLTRALKQEPVGGQTDAGLKTAKRHHAERQCWYDNSTELCDRIKKGTVIRVCFVISEDPCDSTTKSEGCADWFPRVVLKQLTDAGLEMTDVTIFTTRSGSHDFTFTHEALEHHS